MRRLDTLLVLVFSLANGINQVQAVQSLARELQNRMPGAAENAAIVPEEVPEPDDPRARRARREKGIRYNIGKRDLTKPGPDGDVIIDVFNEQVWPRVDLIPVADSSTIVTGCVVSVQAYLSEHRSQVYTEITVAVDEFIKLDSDSALLAPNIIVIDWPGGALRLRDGKVVRGSPHICYLGEPLSEKRYLFFAQSLHNGADLSLVKSYELRDGRVFTNDSTPSVDISTLPGVRRNLADEAAFINDVRDQAMRRARKPTD